LLTKAIRRAQKKVEGINYERRKNVLKYDKVLAQQREAIYSLRDHFLLSEEGSSSWAEIDSYLKPVLRDYVEDLLEEHGLEDGAKEADPEGLEKELSEFRNASFDEDLPEGGSNDLKVLAEEFVFENWETQLNRFKEGEGVEPELIKSVLIKVIDRKWRDHLYLIDDLKSGVGWSSYGGKDPLVEFKRESFRLFQDMRSDLRQEIVNLLVKTRLEVERSAEKVDSRVDTSKFNFQGGESRGGLPDKEPTGTDGSRNKESNQGQRIVEDEPGRNDPCPCGSGKKYKYCCGADD
ncbi:MAG: SEC-C metal-binding domain-containing protein, partial [Candidatus Bipolaricaulota bacterium]